jgi:hypothetical protein
LAFLDPYDSTAALTEGARLIVIGNHLRPPLETTRRCLKLEFSALQAHLEGKCD